MAVLVLDTATETLAVAVGDNHALLGSAAYRVARGHSVLLQPVVAEVMAHAGIKMDALQTIAVGIGPGSYTGVRIGVSTAKAMASVLGVDLVTVPTLFTLAEAAAPTPAPASADGSSVVLAMLYARRQRAFGAVYQRVMGRWE
ncbi:MAG: tRNA (adenosine(37)-N6)-threonylcarbamoyltransferase complex dimerization subunit type 1 TsaB, partial [Alicyclobacillus sp. RIFOXYA1_FULL_53_8]